MQWKRISNVLATDPPYVVHAIRKEGHPCLEACFGSKEKKVGAKLLTVRGSDFQSSKGVHGIRSRRVRLGAPVKRDPLSQGERSWYSHLFTGDEF